MECIAPFAACEDERSTGVMLANILCFTFDCLAHVSNLEVVISVFLLFERGKKIQTLLKLLQLFQLHLVHKQEY